MTPELTAYTAALCVACLALGTQFGAIWGARVVRSDLQQNPPPSDRCYDEGYSDHATGKPRRWNR